MKITVDFDSGPGGAPGESAKDAAAEAREAAALKARLRKILVALTVLCLLLAAAGFAFTRWMMTLPPGTLKGH